MNKSHVGCRMSVFFFSLLNIPSLISSYLTHSIRIIWDELEKLEGATRFFGVAAGRNEHLKVDQALVPDSGVGAPVFNTSVYITRGNGANASLPRSIKELE